MSLTTTPMTLREARAYVNEVHRHHRAPQGGLFAIGADEAPLGADRMTTFLVFMVGMLFGVMAVIAVAYLGALIHWVAARHERGTE